MFVIQHADGQYLRKQSYPMHASPLTVYIWTGVLSLACLFQTESDAHVALTSPNDRIRGLVDCMFERSIK